MALRSAIGVAPRAASMLAAAVFPLRLAAGALPFPPPLPPKSLLGPLPSRAAPMRRELRASVTAF